MNKKELLATAFNSREDEVMAYQINIDNYTMALEEISHMSPQDQEELSGFVEQLKALLVTEKFEQKKSLVMLRVLEKQLQ